MTRPPAAPQPISGRGRAGDAVAVCIETVGRQATRRSCATSRHCES